MVSNSDFQLAVKVVLWEEKITEIRSQLRPSSNTRRPVLSVRRRLTTTPSAAASLVASDSDSGLVDNTTIAGNVDSITIPSNIGNKYNRNRSRPTFSVRTTTERSTKTTNAADQTASSIGPKVVIRRKLARPVGLGGSGGGRTATITSTPATSVDDDFVDVDEDVASQDGNSDDASKTTIAIGETPRTPNPLFRRRFTTTSQLTTVASVLAINHELQANSDIDQEAGSSIQDSKFTNHRFNQIGENLDNEDDKKLVDAIKAMSIVPPPPQLATTKKDGLFTRRMGLVRTSTILTTTPPTITTTRRTIIRRPQKTTPFQALTATTSQPSTVVRRRKPEKSAEPDPFDKIDSRQKKTIRTYRPINDNYDYYDDDDVRFVTKSNSQVKVILHGAGIVECLDQGNFPHPLSCKKFISCAKMENGDNIGWEYTCPKGLSYDPVGGICNWSAGLGCKD